MAYQVLASVLLFNGREKAVQTVKDLLNQRFNEATLRIMVVNNGTDHETAYQIARLETTIEVVSPERNGGFAGGNNIAIERASESNADLLLLLNDDVTLPPNYIERLMQASRANPRVGVIGSTIKLPSGEVQAMGGSLLPFGAGIQWHRSASDVSTGEARVVDAIQGAAFAITNKVIAAGYRLDERLFFGCEEYDLALWARSQKIQTVILEDVEVVHFTDQRHVITNRWHVDPRHYYLTVRNDIFLKLQHFRNSFALLPAISYSVLRTVLKGVLFALKGHPVMLRAVLLGLLHGSTGRMGRGVDFS